MLIEKYNLSLGKTIAVIVTLMIIPVSIGIIGAESSGISYLKFIPNIIGIILGLLLFIFVLKFNFYLHEYIFELTLIAVACMSLTFIFEGIEGVNRWLKIGPMLINISSIIIPLLLYNYFKFEQSNLYKAFIPIIFASVILVFQPDAGQSLALIFGMLPFLPTITKTRKAIVFWVFMLFSSTIVWFQPDPLMPVEHVENIFALISRSQYFGEVLVVISVMSIFAPIVFIGNLTSKLTLSIVFYFFGGLVATLFGHFPVHIIGAGISPVLGIFLAISLIYSEMTPPVRCL